VANLFQMLDNAVQCYLDRHSMKTGVYVTLETFLIVS